MNSAWLERRFKNVAKRQQDHRSPFQRDRARILHSAAFRRLQAKTQIMGSGQSDFYRTRLTHSLEAAQIGSGINAQLRSKYPKECELLLPADDTLIESLCLAHDIGHPPFGHGGEIALNFMMRDHGGFEGNGQTLRIVARLEPYSEHFGMNLTRRTLLGLIKYPQLLDKLSNYNNAQIPSSFRQLKSKQWLPPKGLYQDDNDILKWILEPLSCADKTLFQTIVNNEGQHHKTLFKSFDSSIMEIADDIAYGIHDLEDAIVTGTVTRNDFDDHVIKPLKNIDDIWMQDYVDTMAEKLFSNQHHRQKEAIGGLVNYLITSITLADNHLQHPYSENDHEFDEPILRYNAKLSPTAEEILKVFKDFVYYFVIRQTVLQQREYRGQQLVMELFEALASDPRLLPKNTQQRWQQALDNGGNAHRVIADYVAGMTDDYAMKLYQGLFVPTTRPL